MIHSIKNDGNRSMKQFIHHYNKMDTLKASLIAVVIFFSLPLSASANPDKYYVNGLMDADWPVHRGVRGQIYTISPEIPFSWLGHYLHEYVDMSLGPNYWVQLGYMKGREWWGGVWGPNYYREINDLMVSTGSSSIGGLVRARGIPTA